MSQKKESKFADITVARVIPLVLLVAVVVVIVVVLNPFHKALGASPYISCRRTHTHHDANKPHTFLPSTAAAFGSGRKHFTEVSTSHLDYTS
jgi:hypothetical protein